MRKSISYSFIFFLALTFLMPELTAFASQSEANKTKAEIVDEKETAYVKGITPARARSLAGGVLGLFSLIIGWRVKARSNPNVRSFRSWSITALALGLLAAVLSVVHLAINTGGFGTGGGKAGAIVALVLGLSGALLGGLALRKYNSI